MTTESDQPVYGVFDPDYAVFLSKARCVAKMYGYALATLGSFTRDMDVVAIPWTVHAVPAIRLVEQIEYRTKMRRQQPEASVREHGRIGWSLMFPEFDDPRFIDFSVMPLKS